MANTGPSQERQPAQRFLQAHRSDGTAGELYGIGELAAELGITTRAIRFYEQKGLLAPKRVGSTRIYSRRERARLVLILRGKALGLSLRDIRQYLDLYGERGEGRRQQLEVVIERTGTMIAELTDKQAQLARTLAELKLIRRESQRKLRKMAAPASASETASAAS